MMNHINNILRQQQSQYRIKVCANLSYFARDVLISYNSSKNAQKGHHEPFQKILLSRQFSSAAVTTTADMSKEKSKKKVKDESDEGGMISNNLGKIFGGVLLSIALYFYRLSKNREQKDALIAQVEESYGAEPYEIEDLRNANMQLNARKFKNIAEKIMEAYPSQVTYKDFVVAVSKEFGATMQHGFLLDRVVIKYLQNHPEKNEDGPLPVSFLLAALSLAMYSDVDERAEVFHNLLAKGSTDLGKDAAADFISALQDTCQIPAERNIREDSEKYPIQKYRVISGPEMLEEALEELKEKEKEQLSLEDFSKVLRSKAVCAWGECFHRGRS
mmetsp:Transcript_33835/g.43464  ORF Transcript_33835/g.43464 Transcript_33835/m.43464 type:complete len:330 (-) Transcript_33835:421-1410(-)